MKLKKPLLISFSICLPVLLLGILVFLPTGRFLESHSVSPAGTATVIAISKRATAPSGADDTLTELFIEDSRGKRTSWFGMQGGLFQPSDYVWSKDGSLIAVNFPWAMSINRKDYSMGKGLLRATDVSNGERYDVSGNYDTMRPPSAAGLQVIPQLLSKRGGAVTATWSTPRKISVFERFSFRKK